jgi:hypothetical protein
MNVWALIPLISFLTFAGVVVLVLQQARRRVNKVFALFLSASAVWSFTSFMLHLNAYPQQALLWNELLVAALLWTAVSYYHFVRAYNNKPGGIGAYIGYGCVLILLALSLNGYVVKSSYVVNGVLYHDLGFSLYIIGGVSFIFSIAAMLMLINRYRTSTDATDRNRTMYLIAGSGIVIAVGFFCNLIPAIAGLPYDHLGNLANALIIAYAIQRYHLLNVRLVARRGLTYLLVVTCLVGIYAGAIILGQRFLPDQPLYTILILASALALVLMLLARPLRQGVQGLVDRFFYRGTYEYSQT